MNKILILVEKEYISFTKYNRSISEENLNNTNVINVKNLKFTEEYILENLELVSTFLNLIFLKFKLNKVIIKNLEIAETILLMIKTLSNITSVNFIEDKTLTYTIGSLLLENKNLEHIECYNLPEILFYRFDKNKISTRSKILSPSNFFKSNNIYTHSDLYNKDRIVIAELLSESDIDDMVYFLKTNINLKKIEFKKYSKQNLVTILNFLKKNNVRNVNIIINEDEFTTNDILHDIKYFDVLNKKYCVKIKVKYSTKYKEKNGLKELNIIMLRNILLGILLLLLIVIGLYKLLEIKDDKKIKENIEIIEEKIEEQVDEAKEEEITQKPTEEKNTYVSSYYKEYSKVYNDLLEINSDTIGWLTVNNTKINYPVVQGKDNDYYLNHAYDKTKNIAGWIYVDYRNDMNNISKNTIIYGHSQLKGNIMFSSLKNVLDKKWYENKNNLIISFSIKEKEYKWQIFSIYVIDETNDYLYTDFNVENEYVNFINRIKDRSVKDFGVEVTSNDKILTLSTCYKNDTKRVVVHAKMN